MPHSLVRNTFHATAEACMEELGAQGKLSQTATTHLGL